MCGKLFLITDKDDAGLKKDGKPNSSQIKKQQRHEKLKANLGDRYHCLDCREIENTLSPDVLKKVIQNNEGPEVQLKYKNFNYAKYKDKYLGSFIEANVDGINKSYKSQSGTIKDKVNFSKKAVNHIDSINDLSDEAYNLTEKLYQFIKSNNE